MATYRRDVRASLARIWENVLDWEHLPWLHAETFAHVRLLERRAEGWQAEASLHGGAPFVIDVAIDRTGREYHSRTLAGPGAGGDIVTRLDPRDAHTTAITVEFIVPDVAPELVDAIGAGYRAVYTRLWDEDEAMMRRRQQLLDEAPGAAARTSGEAIPLGLLGDIRPRLPLTFPTPAGPVRVCADGPTGLAAYATTCPHLGGPLEDAPVIDGCIRCPWHGYAFATATGRSADGRGLRLEPRVRIVVDPAGQVVLHVG